MSRLPALLLAGLLALLAVLPGRPAGALTGPGPGPTQAVHQRSYADPFVLRVGTTYYAYATDGDLGEIQVMASQDLVTWTRAGANGEALDGADAPSWAVGDDVWAPTVAPVGSGYVLFASFVQQSNGLRCIGRATSSSPAGPFRADHAFKLCDDANGGVIDPDLFRSGTTTYLQWKSEGIPGNEARPATIWSQPMNAGLTALTGSRAVLLQAREPWQAGVVENPSMVVAGGRTFLFYSGNHFRSASYGLAWARCAGPTGPCVTPPNRPLLTSEPGMHGPGGGAAFTDTTGAHWMPIAAWQDPTRTTESTGQRRLFFRRLDLSGPRPRITGPDGAFREPAYVQRVAGIDRYDTAAAFAASWVQPDRPVTYVATGLTFHDALMAAPAAGKERSPVLLVPRDSVPASVEAQLRRIRPGHIVVMGGTDAVSAAVESRLRTFTAGLHREQGVNVYHRAALVSRNTFAPDVPVVYVATARDFPDALAGGAAAVANGGPLLFVDRDSVPVDPRAELSRLKPRRIVVLGGTAAISHAVLADLAQYSPRVDRVAGLDRYETAALIAEGEFRRVAGTVGAAVVATGRAFPDAVTSGAAGHPVLLVPPTGPAPARVKQALAALSPLGIVVAGGTAAVSPETAASLAP